MDEQFDFTEHMEQLSQIADRLFEALRLYTQLDSEIGFDPEWLGTDYAKTNWREIPNVIRHAILSLVYATYLHRMEVPAELVQWRQDIYSELDEAATKPRHLRRVK